MGRDTLKITDIDFWENEAIPVWNGKKHHFQFSGPKAPTISEAIQWIERDKRRGKV